MTLRAIRHLSAGLAQSLRTLCPEWDDTGFGKTGAEPGLASKDCGAPTALTFREIHGCLRCKEQRLYPRTAGRAVAPAQHCPSCNP